MGFAEGLNAGASAASKWVSAYKNGREWSMDSDFKEALTDANKSRDIAMHAAESDTSLTPEQREAEISRINQNYDDLRRNAYEQRYGGLQEYGVAAAADKAGIEALAARDVDTRARATAYGQQGAIATEPGASKGAAQFDTEAAAKQFAAGLFDQGEQGKLTMDAVNSYLSLTGDGGSVAINGGKLMYTPGVEGAKAVIVSPDQIKSVSTGIVDFGSKISNLLKFKALRTADAASYDAHQKNLSDLETADVKRGLARAQTKYYQRLADSKNQPKEEWKTLDNGVEVLYVNGKATKAIDTNGVEMPVHLADSPEQWGDIQTRDLGLVKDAAKTLQKKGHKDFEVLGTGYDKGLGGNAVTVRRKGKDGKPVETKYLVEDFAAFAAKAGSRNDPLAGMSEEERQNVGALRQTLTNKAKKDAEATKTRQEQSRKASERRAQNIATINTYMKPHLGNAGKESK